MSIEVVTNNSEILSLLCKTKKKYGMFISISRPKSYRIEEIIAAAPYLAQPIFFDIRMNDSGFIFFDTEEELDHHYLMTVGDDGPTITNPYNGPVRVYALTCGPDGDLWNENT